MKLERLSGNKIKIFLTFDDLMDRGLTTDDIRGNSLKVHKLFYEMIEEACTELEFEMMGSIGIEIFSLKAQGLIVIVTRDEEEDFLEEKESFFELDVRLADHYHIFYEFEELEDVIQLCHVLKKFSITSGALYFYEHTYFLLLQDVTEDLHETIISVASEYGAPTTLTIYRVLEYGNSILEDQAVSTITHFFNK